MLWCSDLSDFYGGQLFFLINIGIRQKEWNPTILEFDEGCRLIGLWMIDVW